MAAQAKPIRRVVTGDDAQGRSKVTWDSAAPNVYANLGDRYYTDLWIWNQSPSPLDGSNDDAALGYDFPGPPQGGHLRIVQWPSKPDGYDPQNDPHKVAEHAVKTRGGNTRTLDRGGNNAFTSAIHKTATVDYGIVLEGERVLLIDGHELPMNPGDVVVQVGAWHQWTFPRLAGLMAFDMVAAHFVDGIAGLGQGNDAVMQSKADTQLPPGAHDVKPTRRIVIVDGNEGTSSLVVDSPAPDVRYDPARPGYASTRVWVTDATPAKIVFETLHLPHTIEPPPNGSVCKVITVPPDASWQGKVGAEEVAAFFKAMGSPQASTYTPQAPHAYMQKTHSLDFCIVLEGVATLVLDTAAVDMKVNEVAVIRGSNHAWSNRTDKPVRIAVMSHDGVAKHKAA